MGHRRLKSYSIAYKQERSPLLISSYIGQLMTNKVKPSPTEDYHIVSEKII